MLRTGYLYHFITAATFAGLGVYLLVVPSVLESRGLNSFWVGIFLLLWAVFRTVNGIQVYRRNKREGGR